MQGKKKKGENGGRGGGGGPQGSALCQPGSAKQKTQKTVATTVFARGTRGEGGGGGGRGSGSEITNSGQNGFGPGGEASPKQPAKGELKKKMPKRGGAARWGPEGRLRAKVFLLGGGGTRGGFLPRAVGEGYKFWTKRGRSLKSSVILLGQVGGPNSSRLRFSRVKKCPQKKNGLKRWQSLRVRGKTIKTCENTKTVEPPPAQKKRKKEKKNRGGGTARAAVYLKTT